MKVLVAIILFVSLCGLISCSGHFTVIGAKSVNQNGKYSVAITSRHLNDSDPPMLEVAIHSKAERMTQNITLTNGKSQSLEFDMNGSIADDYVNLTINCVRGLNYNAIATLNLNTKSVSIFVQTNKPIYKPSDVVSFRVLVLDENLQLLNASNVRIFVIDAAQNRVQAFTNPVFRKGVFGAKFSLSDSAILGNWHIETLLANNVTKRYAFEVAEYTLPSFEIILDVKPHVTFAEKQITAFLVAKHTFTEAANGNATLIAEVKNNKIVRSRNISGNTAFVFHIEDDLGLNEENADQTVKLFVTFTEEVTGKSQNATAIVQLHTVPYRLLIKTKSEEFKPGLPFTIEAMVQFHDNNVLLTDNENLVTVDVALVEELFCNYTETFIIGKRPRVVFRETCFGGLSTLRKFNACLMNGTSKIEFTVPKNVVNLSVNVSYLQTKISKNKILSAPSERNHFIVIKSKTQTPKLNENVRINIQSVKNFTEFSYHVFTTQGRLITSDTIQVMPTLDHDFEFTPTDDIKSKIKIIVFYITDYGEIVLDSLLLEFNELKNFVDVQISEESVEPNDEIRIDITSSPNSYVGLLASDRSLSVLNKKVNDISAKIIDENKSDVFFIIHPGSESYIQFSASDDRSQTYNNDWDEEQKPEDDEFRKSFPETWFFDMVDFDVNQSKASISWRAPDTITNWTIIAFSINPTTGLAETSRPTTLKVFKPFFISMDLPHSIIQNEIVSIPISVFNYMEDDQDVHITLYNENSEFTFIEDVLPVARSDKQMTKTLFVKRNSGALTLFKIRANRIGSIKIKAYVTSLLSPGDGIERNLLVKPEGITQYINKAVLIDLRNSSQYTTNLNIFIPDEAVIGSIRIDASIIIGDDILCPFGNLKNLIKLPVGSSEQNMVHFVPNIVILDYLSAVNKLTKEVKTVAIENLGVAYQKQLNYKNGDGSFNVWGKRNETGGTWLTAFIVKCFYQAKRYIFVEVDIIAKGLLFLSQKQSEDGSFEEVEHLRGIQRASSNRIALTAYVLVTFLENTDSMEKHNSMIIKAISFLSQNFNNITDNYSLAIATYALQLAHLADESIKNTFLTKLEEAAVRDGETMRWKASSLDVETTAYALHAFVAAGRLQDSERIMKWLVAQRNENGGFISTQATVVALQALSKVAVKIYSSNTDMDVTINSVLEFSVNERTALPLQKKNLPTSARNFEITATGRGLGIFQISYQYNMVKFIDDYKFNISPPNIRNTVDEKKFYLEFCFNYNQDETNLTSKMAVVEVKLPTGCTFMENFKKELESTESIKRVDFVDTSVTVFIDPLSADNVCPRFHFSKGKFVEYVKHGSIKVYDPNNINHQAVRFF
ncbi:alpha-2-macroglobulin-like [Bradysia coprophila]|uniref:alpha-2-macroglobulin-like n=1 Tax=Bradysia coprophila TaxID=38358 RepID=UPI00187DCD53|nr:alpha-2-macroglobulin-like [Bradysia coprophila]